MAQVKHYSDELKFTVIQAVLSGSLTQASANRMYGIKGHSTIQKWIRKFEEQKHAAMPTNKRTKKHADSAAQLQAENARLRKELELERTKTLSLNVMIDIAEKEFKIPIRKKSGAKRLKK